MGLFDVGLFTDGRRATDEFSEEETRGELAAERAVAPFAMEFGGEGETEEGVRRDDGGVARPGREVVVAIMLKIRYKSATGSCINLKSLCVDGRQKLTTVCVVCSLQPLSLGKTHSSRSGQSATR